MSKFKIFPHCVLKEYIKRCHLPFCVEEKRLLKPRDLNWGHLATLLLLLV